MAPAGSSARRRSIVAPLASVAAWHDHLQRPRRARAEAGADLAVADP
jgi:hypothetical protein